MNTETEGPVDVTAFAQECEESVVGGTVPARAHPLLPPPPPKNREPFPNYADFLLLPDDAQDEFLVDRIRSHPNSVMYMRTLIEHRWKRGLYTECIPVLYRELFRIRGDAQYTCHSCLLKLSQALRFRSGFNEAPSTPGHWCRGEESPRQEIIDLEKSALFLHQAITLWPKSDLRNRIHLVRGYMVLLKALGQNDALRTVTLHLQKMESMLSEKKTGT